MANFEPPELPEFPDIPLPEYPPIPELPPAPELPSGIETLANGAIRILDALNNSVVRQQLEMLETINSAIQAFTAPILTQLAEAASALADAVKNFEFPTLTDEEAEQLVESNRIWGQHGWTYMPSMPISMFDTPPADLAEANKLAMQYCTASEMANVFADLRKWRLNHKDLDSAIFCYQNRQYKASALLLCGMIESKMIRLREDKGRPVGSGAVNELKRQYNDSGDKILAEAMFACNLLAYLEKLFSRTDGFKNEPETLNRNYIGHGMNRRTVRKRDCIQLFLALNNLMQFFDLELL